MDTERLSADFLGMNSCRICQPIMCMNNIKVLCTCHDSGNYGVVVYLIMKIRRIATGKFHTSEVIHIHIVKIRIEMVPQAKIVIRIHHIADSVLYVIIIYISPSNRHAIHGNNPCRRMIFITERFWQAQGYIHIPLGMQTLGNTEISCCKSTIYMRRILPAKH